MKYSDELLVDDFREHPVWQFINSDDPSDDKRELAVEPVVTLPVNTLDGRFIGTECKLACGRKIWAELLGVKLNDPRLTKLVMSIIVHDEERKFLMRRVAPAVSGPSKLADFLGLKAEEVFPIYYDISSSAIGDESVLKGIIPFELDEHVSRSELLKLLQTKRQQTVG